MDEMTATAGNGYLTPERIMMRDMARQFVDEEVTPIANRLDPERGDIPRELIAKMGELGFFGIMIPEEFGGLGLGAMEYCMVTEELARGWMSVSSLLARGNEFYRAIPGNKAQRREKIAAMIRGDYLGAGAMSEPQTGSDLSGIATKARRDGDEWVITGNKYWCTFADGADFIIVLCKLDDPGAASGRAGTIAIAVEKPKGELPKGVSGAPIPKIGYFGWKTWELRFEEVRVPVQPDDGWHFEISTELLSLARAQTAARSIGLAQAALEHAMGYAKERIQFRRPISDFQSIRFKLAQMATEIQAARQLLYHSCGEIDAGKPATVEASMVKYFAAEMSERVTSEALQILGGAGYTTLHPVERYWRDSRVTKIFEGTSEIMLRIISDRMLGKPTTAEGSRQGGGRTSQAIE